MYNEADNIEKWLSSLKSQTVTPDEVVIVDGGSTDDTCKMLLAAGLDNLTLVKDPTCSKKYTKGPIAKGRNVAIENSTNEYIVATDAGCVLHQNFISEMKRTFCKGADYVCGTYDLLSPNEYQNKLKKSFFPDFSKVNFPGGFLPSSRSIGFTKENWENAGRYPEESFAGEDTKFARELVKISSKPLIALGAIVYWDSPKSRRELRQKCIEYGRGDAILRQDVLKHLARLLIIVFPPLFVFLTLRNKRSVESFFIYLYTFVGFFKGMCGIK